VPSIENAPTRRFASLTGCPPPQAGEGEERVAEAQERARALEQRAILAEGRLREAHHLARDMEERALAVETLIARGREGW